MDGKGVVAILADDPLAAGELEQLCAARGWRFVPDAGEKNAFSVFLG